MLEKFERILKEFNETVDELVKSKNEGFLQDFQVFLLPKFKKSLDEAKERANKRQKEIMIPGWEDL